MVVSFADAVPMGVWAIDGDSDVLDPDGVAIKSMTIRNVAQLPVLLMSGYSAERQRAYNLDELICKVVSKPFTLKEICDAAEQALFEGGFGARLDA